MTLYIWISLILAATALVLSLASLYFNTRTKRYLNRFFRETGHEEFGDVLLSHQRRLSKDKEIMTQLKQRIGRLENDAHFLLSQVGLVRYNPFPNSGGNMSFSLALLNDNGDGVVLTSLHSRDGVRVYSKSINQFKSEQALMDEEKEAIELAKRNNN